MKENKKAANKRSGINIKTVVDMGYHLQKNKITLGNNRRIFFKRKNIIRFAYPLAILFGFVLALSMIAPAFAIETTKASALTLEEMRENYTLSRTSHVLKKSPQIFDHGLCLSFFTAHQTAYDAHHKDYYAQTDSSQHSAAPKAMPASLGFVLGVKIALGSRKFAAGNNYINMMPDHQNAKGGTSHAHAVAAYRGCKKNQALLNMR